MDQGRFIKGYIEALAAKVASVTPAQPFIKALLEATEAIVMQPEAGRKNEERFWRHYRSKRRGFARNDRAYEREQAVR